MASSENVFTHMSTRLSLKFQGAKAYTLSSIDARFD